MPADSTLAVGSHTGANSSDSTVLSFMRKFGSDAVVVLLNFSAQPARATLELPPAVFHVRTTLRDALTSEYRQVAVGAPLTVQLPPHGWSVLVRNR